MNRTEIFAFIGCSVTVGGILWKIIVLKLNSEIKLLQQEFEDLKDSQILADRGLEQKIGHFSDRVKAAMSLQVKRTRAVENFLAQKAGFNPLNEESGL